VLGNIIAGTNGNGGTENAATEHSERRCGEGQGEGNKSRKKVCDSDTVRRRIPFSMLKANQAKGEKDNERR